MTDPIVAYSGLMRMQIDRLNSIANNASNVNSAGYLQEMTSISNNQFQNLLHTGKPQQNYSISRDLKLGSLNVTNQEANLAVTTNDWFQLESNDGASVITRNGKFTISSDGNLMLGDFKVLGESGPIESLKSGFKVHADGAIYQGDTYVNKLKLINISDNHALISLGNGVYSSSSQLMESKNAKVVQGALVSSNVDLQGDMTKMVEITRHVEMLQRAMSAYNDLLDVGINKIGK